jgi:hypothetical protein
VSPPENEFPAGIGATVLLARTDDVAVGLTQVEAFSTGSGSRSPSGSGAPDPTSPEVAC